MSMDMELVASIIKASSELAPPILHRLLYKEDDQSQLTQAEKVMSKVYEKLRPHLSGGCVRVLLIVEHGGRPHLNNIWQSYYPNLQISDSYIRERLKREFQYRLKMLCLLGLLLQIGEYEYHITPLGYTFLAVARRSKHYLDVLNERLKDNQT